MRVDVSVTVPLSFTVNVEEGETIQGAVESFVNNQVRLDIDGEIEIINFDAPIDINLDQTLCVCESCNEDFAEDLDEGRCVNCQAEEE